MTSLAVGAGVKNALQTALYLLPFALITITSYNPSRFGASLAHNQYSILPACVKLYFDKSASIASTDTYHLRTAGAASEG